MSAPRSWITVRDLLVEETRDELATRAGQWAAFREQVQWQLDRREGARRQLSWEDQAVRAWVDEVQGEVAAVSPRFEGGFRDEVERRIFERAIEPRSGWSRWIQRLRTAWSAGPSWAMAGGLAAAAVVVGLGLSGGGPEAPAGEVRLDALSFEGSAMVTVDHGVTVVMLASAAD